MKRNTQKRLIVNKYVNRYIAPELRGTVAAANGNMWVKIDDNNFPDGSYFSRKISKKLKIDTVQYRILKRIWESGNTGLTFTDIQMFILGGEDQLQKGPSNLPRVDDQQWDHDNGGFTGRVHKVRASRGHYSTWLSYTMPAFCTKGDDGRWRLTQKDLLVHFKNRFE